MEQVFEHSSSEMPPPHEHMEPYLPIKVLCLLSPKAKIYS